MKRLKGSPGMVIQNNKRTVQKDAEFFKAEKNDGVVFVAEVPDIEGLRVCVFNAIDATLETMKKQKLQAGDVKFDYKGAAISCEIRLNLN